MATGLHPVDTKSPRQLNALYRAHALNPWSSSQWEYFLPREIFQIAAAPRFDSVFSFAFLDSPPPPGFISSCLSHPNLLYV